VQSNLRPAAEAGSIPGRRAAGRSSRVRLRRAEPGPVRVRAAPPWSPPWRPGPTNPPTRTLRSPKPQERHSRHQPASIAETTLKAPAARKEANQPAEPRLAPDASFPSLARGLGGRNAGSRVQSVRRPACPGLRGLAVPRLMRGVQSGPIKKKACHQDPGGAWCGSESQLVQHPVTGLLPV